jgi:hypothetical protein
MCGVLIPEGKVRIWSTPLVTRFTQRGKDAARGFVRVAGRTISGTMDATTRVFRPTDPNVYTLNGALAGA